MSNMRGVLENDRVPYPENKDPRDIQKLFGSKCNPVHIACFSWLFTVSDDSGFISPATDALVKSTVMNHIG